MSSTFADFPEYSALRFIMHKFIHCLLCITAISGMTVNILPVCVYTGIFIPSKMYIIRHFPTNGRFFDKSLYKMYVLQPKKNKVVCTVSKITKRA